MSLSQPIAYLPAFSAVCSTALESVFCISTSAPPLISDCAASVSFGGLNHSLTQTTLVLLFGFTDCAPSVKLSMFPITSGIGIAPTTPGVLALVQPPSPTGPTYAKATLSLAGAEAAAIGAAAEAGAAAAGAGGSSFLPQPTSAAAIASELQPASFSAERFEIRVMLSPVRRWDAV